MTYRFGILDAHVATMQNTTLSLFDGSLFNDVFRTFNTIGENVEQNDKGVTLELDVPGIAKEDIEIGESNGVLTIRGETGNRSFKKRYRLFTGADIKNIDASLVNGVLRVEVPRKTSKSRSIRIK